MQQALGLMGEQAVMFAITVALGIGGIAALLMALFWPRRWRMRARLEVAFVVLLLGLALYGDYTSSRTYQAYEAELAAPALRSGAVDEGAPGAFDRHIRAYTFQWGFLFLDEQGAASRNAVLVGPGETVAFTILANDVMHGLNIPVAGMTTEIEPGEPRRIWIRAPRTPGKYLIQCLNYCGLGHAQMKAWLVVGDPEGEPRATGHG